MISFNSEVVQNVLQVVQMLVLIQTCSFEVLVFEKGWVASVVR